MTNNMNKGKQRVGATQSSLRVGATQSSLEGYLKMNVPKFKSSSKKPNKFLTKVNESDTRKLDAATLESIVSTMESITLPEAQDLIKMNHVSINGIRTIDASQQLKSGDVIRVGMIGHFINDNRGIAIIK